MTQSLYSMRFSSGNNGFPTTTTNPVPFSKLMNFYWTISPKPLDFLQDNQGFSILKELEYLKPFRTHWNFLLITLDILLNTLNFQLKTLDFLLITMDFLLIAQDFLLITFDIL